MNLLLKKIKILKQIIALLILKLAMKKKKPRFIIFHHEGANNGFYSVNAWHKKKVKKWHLKHRKGIPFNVEDYKSSLGFYCGYTYFINNNGTTHQARADNEEGAHCLGGYNRNSIGICCQGNLMKRDMTDGQKYAARKLINHLIIKYNIPKSKVFAHREARKGETLCPGTWGMMWLRKYRNY